MKVISRFRYPLLVVILCLGFVWVFGGFDQSLVTVTYTLAADQVEEPLRIALITDLHSCYYGEGQTTLVSAIDAASPDILVMVGDMVDDRLPWDHALEFFEAIAGRYPSYYVSGNHEVWSGNSEGIKTMIRSYGIEVLEGDLIAFELRGQTIEIAGIDDPDLGSERWTNQLEQVAEESSFEAFTVLLSHRPELVDVYGNYAFDLVLAGHAHGGQWRLPGLVNGLIAPNQGFFPAYAGGVYEFDNQTMIVSRGLARESTRVPRIFNRPELVMIDIF